MNSELEVYRVDGETEKRHVTNAVEGTEQCMRSSQWVAKLKELRGGSNQWRDLVEMGSVFRFLKDKYFLSSTKGKVGVPMKGTGSVQRDKNGDEQSDSGILAKSHSQGRMLLSF